MTKQEVIDIYAVDGTDITRPEIRAELIEKSQMVLAAIESVGTIEEREAAHQFINSVLEVLNNWD